MHRNVCLAAAVLAAALCFAAPSAALAVDTTPPTVTCSVPPYNVTTATVTIAASDAGGVGRVLYRLDTGSTVTVSAATATFNVTAEGTHTVRYAAVDSADNTATPKSASFVVYGARDDDEIPGILWGSPVTGRLNGTTDINDVYQVRLRPDDRLQVTLRGDIDRNDFDVYLYGPRSTSVEDLDYITSAYPWFEYPKTMTFLVPPGGGGTHYLDVFGMARFGSGAGPYTLGWSVDHPFSVRMSAEDRYATAEQIARSTFARCSWAVLVSGNSFADALAGAGLAGAYRAPLLLVRDGRIPEDVIASLGVTHVLIVGGKSAVSRDVESFLASETEGLGLYVKRIEGATRYETAAKVADQIKVRRGTVGTRALVARGDAFPDALALAPFAYSRAMPLLLVKPSSATTATTGAISRLGTVTHATVAGGPGAISEQVLHGLGIARTNVQRWYGEDRYETAAEVAERGVAAGWGSFGFVGVANGEGYADALPGGVACGQRGGILLLTRPTATNAHARLVLKGHAGDVSRMAFFGGTSVVSEAVKNELTGIVAP